MKRYVRSSVVEAATKDKVVMKSPDGLFQLVEISGVGREYTPWSGYTVESLGEAKDYVVEVRLRSSWEEFDGPDHPVKYKYYDVEVAHGMRSRRESLDETERYIEILKSALDFAKKIEKSDIIEKG